MYRYKNLHNRFSADTCTSTFVTADMYIFLWYLLIRENFANEAVLGYKGKSGAVAQRSEPLRHY